MMHRVVFLTGILATTIFLIAVIWGGATYPGYDHLRQFISELGATGAVTAGPMNLAFMASSALIVLFWIGVLFLVPRTALTIVGCAFGALNGLSLYLAGVYSCDFECARSDQTPAALLHDVFGGLGYVAAIIGMVAVAFASSRWPVSKAIRPIGLVCATLGLIGFLGIVGEPEMKGLLQRIAETGMWSLILAVGFALNAQAANRPPRVARG